MPPATCPDAPIEPSSTVDTVRSTVPCASIRRSTAPIRSDDQGNGEASSGRAAARFSGSRRSSRATVSVTRLPAASAVRNAISRGPSRVTVYSPTHSSWPPPCDGMNGSEYSGASSAARP